MKFLLTSLVLSFGAFAAIAAPVVVDTDGQEISLEAGHPSLQKWKLPDTPPHPRDNEPTPQRVELGKGSVEFQVG
jgi:hypothetical protein